MLKKINTLFTEYVSHINLENILIQYTELENFKALQVEVSKCIHKTVVNAEFDNHQQQLDKIFYNLKNDYYFKPQVDGFVQELNTKCRKNFDQIELQEGVSKKLGQNIDRLFR